MSNKLTIFNNDTYSKEIQTAIKSLISGKTPIAEVREKDGRGGKDRYVNGYYMFRQASLITGFRWSSKCLREKYFPSEDTPSEVGALMEVTIYDQSGNTFSHQSWGGNKVQRYNKDKREDGKLIHKAGDIISLFDDLKAAYTDGIKKCLSYFGIANDIYGGKELNYFESEEESSNGKQPGIVISSTDQRAALDAYIRNKHIRYDKALEIIGVSSMNDIIDYKAAYDKLTAYIGGGIS